VPVPTTPHCKIVKFDRRAAERHQCDLPVTLRLFDDPTIRTAAISGDIGSGGLPPITYDSGGLEDANIPKAVCDVLEGGDDAFRERARRLRVRLER
jgi:hypothetical protein